MFFIVGIRDRRTAREAGVFHCPNEGADRPYRHMRARRWFTVFLIPLIPLGVHRRWLSCQGCGTTYGIDVLRQQPAQRAR